MIIKMVRKNFKNLGNIRDTHIMLENCQTMKIQFPLIYDFIAYLLAKEKKMVTNFSDNISQVDFNEIEGMMYFLIRILKYDYPTIRPDFTIFEQRINENLKFLQEIYSQIDYSNTKTIHQFRIATKKYRYSTEILQDFVQDYQNLYKKLVKIQDDAGAIQDSVVLINKFKYFISKRNYNDYSTEFQISNILNFLEETQQDLIKAFRNDEELIKSVIYV
jgi:CHAD domain-containing protein